MIDFTIPKGGFWHCRVVRNEKEWPINQFDMTYDQLDFEIVQPFIKNQQFFINGVRFANSQGISRIKIVHTEKNNDFYGTRKLSGGGVIVLGPTVYKVFEIGDDWTSRLLQKAQTIPPKKSQMPPSNTVINVNQTQFQTQHQEQNLTLSNIQQLQDAFADFRQEYKKLHGVDDSILKETQDALDELSTTSSSSEKNKALSKLRRVLKGAEEVFDRVGEKATKALLFYETLKKIYDTIMGFFSN